MTLKSEIGVMAGRIYRLLDAGGPQTSAQVRKKLEAKPSHTDYALGWLAREDKIEFIPDKRTFRVTLK